ncbi:MAG: hypothetical protein ACI3VJ_04865, partial [Hominicoprocola sp.]
CSLRRLTPYKGLCPLRYLIMSILAQQKNGERAIVPFTVFCFNVSSEILSYEHLANAADFFSSSAIPVSIAS